MPVAPDARYFVFVSHSAALMLLRTSAWLDPEACKALLSLPPEYLGLLEDPCSRSQELFLAVRG